MTSLNDDKDLDINDYNFEELLRLFSVDDDFTLSNMERMKLVLNTVRTEKPEYFDFYAKAFKIIKVIYGLKEQNIIFNTKFDVEVVADKVKGVKNFENQRIEQLMDLIGISEGKTKLLETKIEYPAVQEPIRSGLVPNSFPNVVAPGSLNSLKRLTQQVNLNLNSRFRNNYYKSNPCDFQYTIPTEIKNVISMRLSSIEIPNAWYMFSNSKRNTNFIIEISNGGTITEYPITIPEGNYTYIELETILNDTYFYNSGTMTDLQYIKFSINPNTLKSGFEILPSPIPGFCFTVIFWDENVQNPMSTFGWIIGFRIARYKNINTYILSEGLYSIDGDAFFYVSINDYQYNTNTLNIVCFDNSVMEQNIIAKISYTVNKFELISDNNTSPTIRVRRYNGPVNIKNFQMKILDQYGNVINLNNMDFSFSLELDVLYENFNFKDIIA